MNTSTISVFENQLLNRISPSPSTIEQIKPVIYQMYSDRIQQRKSSLASFIQESIHIKPILNKNSLQHRQIQQKLKEIQSLSPLNDFMQFDNSSIKSQNQSIQKNQTQSLLNTAQGMRLLSNKYKFGKKYIYDQLTSSRGQKPNQRRIIKTDGKNLYLDEINLSSMSKKPSIERKYYDYKNVEIVFDPVNLALDDQSQSRAAEKFVKNYLDLKQSHLKEQSSKFKHLDYVLREIVSPEQEATPKYLSKYQRTSRSQEKKRSNNREHRMIGKIFEKEKDIEKNFIFQMNSEEDIQIQRLDGLQSIQNKKKKSQGTQYRSSETNTMKLRSIVNKNNNTPPIFNNSLINGYAPRVNSRKRSSRPFVEISFQEFIQRKPRQKKFSFSDVSQREWQKL